MAKNKKPRKPYVPKVAPVVRSSAINRDYGYKRGEVNLDFTLRADIKDEMVIFLQLMELAKADIEEQLSKLN